MTSTTPRRRAADPGWMAAQPEAMEQRVWIIDPLDGTVNYANGIPMFCVSIGLTIGGGPTSASIYDPARDEMFTALAGQGAKLDGLPSTIPSRKADRLCRFAVAAAAADGGTARQDWPSIRVSRNMGSAALALAYLANGRFDAFVQAGGLSLWDICAAGLIAIEGGARLTALDGLPWFESATRRSRSLCWAPRRRTIRPCSKCSGERLAPYWDVHGPDHTVTGHVLVWPDLHSPGLQRTPT